MDSPLHDIGVVSIIGRFFYNLCFFWNLVLGEKLICVLILTEVWTFVIWGCVFSARVCVCGSQTQLFQNQGPQSAPSFCTLAHKACALILHKEQTWNLEMEVRCFLQPCFWRGEDTQCNVTSDSWGFVSQRKGALGLRLDGALVVQSTISTTLCMCSKILTFT